MSTTISITHTRTSKNSLRRLLGTVAAAGLLFTTALVYADAPVTMAPPVQGAAASVADADNPSEDTVFQWTEIPQNQQVTLTRAVFDRGGYQLYDTVGETIVVPFSGQNLYVMKFGRSTSGHLYFVNDGGTPTLYVPKDGYLENATVAGARWYPFPKEFHAEKPVYLGIAPSYPDFIGMGWYPGMTCFGGYYSSTAFIGGAVFLPTAGLFFQIGGHPYYGWGGYHSYFVDHPTYYRVNYYQRNIYRGAERPFSSLNRFQGAGHEYYAHREFTGAGRSFYGHRASADGRSFHGADGGFGGNRGGDRGFGGGDRGFGGGDRGFGGGDRGFGGGDRGFGGGDRGFGRRRPRLRRRRPGVRGPRLWGRRVRRRTRLWGRRTLRTLTVSDAPRRRNDNSFRHRVFFCVLPPPF